MSSEPRFWETTALADMTRPQWESLCDGCARCCMQKLQNDDTEDIFYTNVACRLLDTSSCRCGNYTERQTLVPDCMVLTPEHSGDMSWLPNTCAYRLLDAGKPLPEWHPLLTGDPDSVHLAGMSVRGRTVPEESIDDDDCEDYIIRWIAPTRRDREV